MLDFFGLWPQSKPKTKEEREEIIRIFKSLRGIANRHSIEIALVEAPMHGRFQHYDCEAKAWVDGEGDRSPGTHRRFVPEQPNPKWSGTITMKIVPTESAVYQSWGGTRSVPGDDMCL